MGTLNNHQRDFAKPAEATAARTGDREKAEISPATGLAGNLATCSMSEILGMLSIARKTGILSLRHGAVSGWLRLRAGRLVDAHCGLLQGREAALFLVGWSKGRFEFEAADPNARDGRGEAVCSIEELLLEHAWREDSGTVAAPEPTAIETPEPAEDGRPGTSEVPAELRPARDHGPRSALAGIAVGLLLVVTVALGLGSFGSSSPVEPERRVPESGRVAMADAPSAPASLSEPANSTPADSIAEIDHPPPADKLPADELPAASEPASDPPLLERAAATPSPAGAAVGETTARPSEPGPSAPLEIPAGAGGPAPASTPEAPLESPRTASAAPPQEAPAAAEEPPTPSAVHEPADESRTPPPVTETGARPPAPALPELDLPDLWVGDLVEPGPEVVEPRQLAPLRLRLSRVQRRTQPSTTVPVSLLIDHDGVVRKVELGPPADGLSDNVRHEIAAAARRTRFEPATKRGIRVSMWITLDVALPGD